MNRRREFGFLGAWIQSLSRSSTWIAATARSALFGEEKTHNDQSAGAFYFDAVIRACGLDDDAMVFRRSRGRAIVAELAHDTAPAGEVNRNECRDRPSRGPGAERRELGRKTIGVDLEQPLG